MSGLAAGIRLAQFGRNVLILERHNAPGGLNSFYALAGRKFDVGLHAVTNYVPQGVRTGPLVKICRQLRIGRDELDLCPQHGSRVAFPGEDLRFNNDFALLESEVARVFPRSIDAFRTLVSRIREYDDTHLDESRAPSARTILETALPDRRLREMLLCPLMYYGSARPGDMDFDQFVTLFKAVFLEGFARPFEGVRRIIRVLLQRYREAGGERRMKCGVRSLRVAGGRVSELELDDGRLITADHVISSIGRLETLRLCADRPSAAEDVEAGPLSFAESIAVLDVPPASLGCSETIVFFNDSPSFAYGSPEHDLIDTRSGVICVPNNYAYGDDQDLDEGFFRVTALASYAGWTGLPEERYQAEKRRCYARMQDSAVRFLPGVACEELQAHTRTTDMFTPRTIERFTGHISGAVYGAPDKVRDGRTHLDNLYLCGTDQGFLGIVGAMLSGISMANLHIIRKEG